MQELVAVPRRAPPVSLVAARAALEQATDLPAVASLIDRLAVIRVAARKARQSLDAQNDWATIKLEAERKAGRMLADLRQRGDLRAGRPNADGVSALSELAISQQQSSRWQRLGAVPDALFARWLAETRRCDQEINEAAFFAVAVRVMLDGAGGADDEFFVPQAPPSDAPDNATPSAAGTGHAPRTCAVRDYRDRTLTLLVGDAAERLRDLPEKSVQAVVTSPPYFGLRNFGTATWEGGDAVCDHRQNGTHVGPKSTLRNDGREHTGPYDGERALTEGLPYREVCGKCGARRIDAQLGLEPTPEEYVANMVAVFREVRRVLRDDGTVWLNLGDSYAGSGPSGATYQSETTKRRAGQRMDGNFRLSKRLAERGLTYQDKKPHEIPDGLKPKDLVGIPWRVAFALQADGWYLRSDIIWSKPNPMPESITDRPTKAHEFVFLLSKSPLYYFDAEAIKETASEKQGGRNRVVAAGKRAKRMHVVEGARSGTTIDTYQDAGTRNKRDVWTIATQPFAGAHFATFPPALVAPCVLAGTSEWGGCPACGTPWVRDTQQTTRYEGGSGASGFHETDDLGGKWSGKAYGKNLRLGPVVSTATIGWRRGCTCEASRPVPQTVLDPFAGAGTTALVAEWLGRHSVLIELNPDYAAVALERLGRRAAEAQTA